MDEPILVDSIGIVFRGKPRYHLCCKDTKQLDQFAEQIGVKRCWRHRSPWIHYDITDHQRDTAIAAGAIAVTSREIVRHMRGYDR